MILVKDQKEIKKIYLTPKKDKIAEIEKKYNLLLNNKSICSCKIFSSNIIPGFDLKEIYSEGIEIINVSGEMKIINHLSKNKAENTIMIIKTILENKENLILLENFFKKDSKSLKKQIKTLRKLLEYEKTARSLLEAYNWDFSLFVSLLKDIKINENLQYKTYDYDIKNKQLKNNYKILKLAEDFSKIKKQNY